MEVSTAWKELLTSESYQKKAKYLFHSEIAQDTRKAGYEEKLWYAAKEGNVEEVQRLSRFIFVDVNCVKGWNRSTPLYEAAMNALNSLASNASLRIVIQLLIKRGANPNLADFRGCTPLRDAAICGNNDLIQLLLDGGADPNKEDEDGRTPLRLAQNKDVVDLLKRTGRKRKIPSDRN